MPETVLERLQTAPHWVRKSVRDDARKSDSELLRQAQWHERTAQSHRTAADALRALLAEREAGASALLAEVSLYDVADAEAARQLLQPEN